jgi:ABC-type bacteriocin/lantibiotic exporter with double-glycine peptidase domain
MILAPVQLIATSIMFIQPGILAYKRTRSLLSNTATDFDTGINIDRIKSIEFSNVSFSYDNKENVIENLSIAIGESQTVMVLGQNGSGKSTLLKLILGFFDNYAGSIKINGIDLSEISKNSLRKCIGIVFQNPILFAGSVLENIECGQSSIENADLDSALHLSTLDREYSGNEGKLEFLSRNVSESGKKLSGGQKQKTAIARALFRAPSLLILDEATSNLDNESERLLFDELYNNHSNIKIIISHDDKYRESADFILELSVNKGVHKVISKH